jgi:hypothetical protein
MDRLKTLTSLALLLCCTLTGFRSGIAQAETGDFVQPDENVKKSIEFKQLPGKASAKMKFQEAGTKVRMEFEGTNLHKGKYFLFLTSACSKKQDYTQADLAEDGVELTEFSTDADAVSQEATIKEKTLKTAGDNSLVQSSVLLLIKQAGKLRAIGCALID